MARVSAAVTVLLVCSSVLTAVDSLATWNNGSPSAEDTETVEVVNRAIAVNFYYETVDGGAKVLLTCKSSGPGFLLVQLLKGTEYLEKGKNGVESYTPGISTHGGSLTVQARMALPSQSAYYFCEVMNSTTTVSESVYISV